VASWGVIKLTWGFIRWIIVKGGSKEEEEDLREVQIDAQSISP